MMRAFFLISLYLVLVKTEPRQKRQSKCPWTSFTCSNGQCISSTSVCDGVVDCGDRSDETRIECTKKILKCPTYSFRCAYGACVDKIKKCNGVQDCADNSDELLPECRNKNVIGINNALCKKYEFACTSGQCISNVLVCDGEKDCLDGSEETNTQCINLRCPTYGFQCAYGACIDDIKKCDGKDDCLDGSDEDRELCKDVITTSTRTTTSIIGKCRLPKKPEEGNYKIKGCTEDDDRDECHKSPSTLVGPNVELSFSCNDGYVLPDYHGQNSYCHNGTWVPQPPKCQKLCKGLHSDSVNLTCNYRGEQVDCREPARPGTKVEARCHDMYQTCHPSMDFKRTECAPNGQWVRELYQCFPECGLHKNVNVQIKSGDKAGVGEYPWHTSIYIEKMDGKVTLHCEGSIISPKAILTAAHCLHNDITGVKIHESKVKVAVGKHKSKWTIQEETEQKFQVEKISIPNRYTGLTTRHEQDIAILFLDKTIKFSNGVMPVCLDKHQKFALYKHRNAVGTVIRWNSIDANGKSEELIVARFPAYGISSSSPESVTVNIESYDKFYAELEEGTRVQEGNSGGGLTFHRDIGDQTEQHFIYGILILLNEQVVAFINISEHVDWIEKEEEDFLKTKMII